MPSCRKIIIICKLFCASISPIAINLRITDTISRLGFRSALHINSSTFPSDRAFVRTTDFDNPRSIYICNPLVRDIISCNDPARIRLINCGVKAFTRQQNHEKGAEKEGKEEEAEDVEYAEGAATVDGSTKKKELVFRFVYEGVETILPHVEPSSILVADLKDLRKMLEAYYPPSANFHSPFGEQIKAAGKGFILLSMQGPLRELTVP